MSFVRIQIITKYKPHQVCLFELPLKKLINDNISEAHAHGN